jgi:nicotinate phosphoribosyltransferase
MVDYRQFSFTPSKVEPLLKKRLENGKRTSPRLPESEQLKISRNNMMSQLDTFDESYKRILNPHIYKVSITENLKDLKLDFINKNIK